MTGLTLILFAAVLWGIGAFLSKIAVLSINPWATSLVRSLVFFPIVAGYISHRTDITWEADRSTAYACGAGLLAGGTVLSTRLALTVYDVSLVSPIKRLSLLVTVLFALVLLNETLTRRKALGIGAALGALVLLSA